MPLEIIRNDITKVEADAIVNAANVTLLGGGGVDGAIHRAAGPELTEACRGLGGCRVGEAKWTKGYRLPAKYVIHTVGPFWKNGGEGEKEKLEACYRHSLDIAKELKLESVAFPLISTGAFGYPKDQALQTAISVIGEFLLENDIMVYLVVYDKGSFVLSEKLFSDIEAFIDDRYVEKRRASRRDMTREAHYLQESYSEPLKDLASKALAAGVQKASNKKLEDLMKELDESFSEMLLRCIGERDLTDAQAYKMANVDRKLFSKIRNNTAYKPSKQTALAFAIALKMDLEETKKLLEKAGFALSHSSKFDIIIEYFIVRKNYNIFEINEALFAFEQSTLGV